MSLNIHFCALDRDCRSALKGFGVPWRLSWTWNGNYRAVAFRPGDRFVQANGKVTWWDK